MINKKLTFITLGVLVLGIAAYSLSSNRAPSAPSAGTAFNPLDATYTIEGQPVTLVNGKSEVPAAPGSSANVVTTVFGSPVSGDLNNDGLPDAALMLVQNSGGSGTFYYIAAAMNTASGTAGTNAILLGDRIAPQDVEINNGEAVANYAVRKPGEPMTAQPSLAVSKFFVVDGVTLSDKHPTAGPGEHCGGNTINPLQCEAGYRCALTISGGHIPSGDTGGTCVAD